MDTSSVVAQIEGIEWIVLLVIIAVILLFGPTKIPQMAHGIGRALGEFKRGRLEVENEIKGNLK